MTPQEQQFYENLFPCLRDRDWWHTGAQSFGLVWWRINLPYITVDEITAAVQVGLVKLPNSSKLFAQINTDGYPSLGYTCDLPINVRQASSEEVKANAMSIALQLLSDKTEVIRQRRQQWLDELEEMRSNGANLL